MKIVIVKGSPHKNGSSNMLAEQFAKGAREAGHTVVETDAAHMNIHPCLGCGHCGMDGPCAQRDDMQLIRDALLSADMAVFVTPVLLLRYLRAAENGDRPLLQLHFAAFREASKNRLDRRLMGFQ